jgi:hypothetical protein
MMSHILHRSEDEEEVGEHERLLVETTDSETDVAFAPHDKDDPRNWSPTRKWLMVAAIIPIDLSVSWGASGFACSIRFRSRHARVPSSSNARPKHVRPGPRVWPYESSATFGILWKTASLHCLIRNIFVPTPGYYVCRKFRMLLSIAGPIRLLLLSHDKQLWRHYS